MKKKNPSKASKKDFLVVGLGASAGGVRALQEFFATMPPNSGMAFVAILHLSPEHESNLAEILQAQTAMTVTPVTKTVKVEPNNVYVIPPNVQLEMVDGVIRPSKAERPHGHRVAIDVFFRTLAEAYGKNAVCVVLSGTGSDGTLGLKRVKESNGFAVVQNPEDAEYDSMPRSAINTQLVDWVLPVHQMPEKLIHFKESSERLHLTNGADAEKIAEEIRADESLREILTLLRVRTGHDFSNYKMPTLVRRVARHLQIHELEDIPSYLDLLRQNPNETHSLLKNLLINVTNFFRDKDAFAALEASVIPNLFAGKTGKDTIRVWSCGCASGEEAYSLAMLLNEHSDLHADPPKIQVFASDVDDEAIAEAREGRFPESIEADIPQERLKRFFTKEGSFYRVKKELRERILFAPHNVLRDPPFSRLNLIACRNLLIYLNRETQDRVLQIFHFALDRDGYLFLGSSETAENLPTLYAPIEKKQRIYARRHAPAQSAPLPLMPVAGRWEARLSVERKSANERDRAQTVSEIHYKLLENYAPSSVLVNQDFDIVYLSQNAGKFLRFTSGEPSRNILKVVHPDLLPDLRAALYTAQSEHKPAEFPNVRVSIDGEQTVVNLIVRAVDVEDEASDFLLVIFEEKNSPAVLKKTDKQIEIIHDKDEAMETVVRRLEEDLQRTKEHLRFTIEQHETSIEELKASNEELQAINEELRSASEELETSKEELQSVNEELTTVNHELKDKIDETGRINSDLQNLMAATDIATIFLDKQLKIKRYTPPVEDIFNITAVDIGRPLAHFTHRLNYDNLASDAGYVLRRLKTLEREISDRGGNFYLARLAPYRTIDDRIDGVVLNFIDISERKRTEDALRLSEEKYRTLFDSIDEGFHVIELVYDEAGAAIDYRFLEVNPVFERMTGLKNAAGKLGSEIAPNTESYWLETYDRAARTGEPQRVENYNQDTGRWYRAYASRIANARNQVAVVFDDITERKRWERELTRSNQLLQATFDNSLLIIQLFKAVRDERTGEIVDFEWVMTNERWDERYGSKAGKRLLAENPAVIETGLFDEFKEVTETGIPVTQEHYYKHEQFDGWFLQTAAKVEDGFLLSTLDITERKRAEIALSESEEKYRTLFDSIDEGYLICEVIFNENDKPVDILYLDANPAAARLAGRDFTGRRMREIDPDYEDYWYEMIGRVALTGEAVRAEHYAATHNRWFDFYAFKIGGEESRRVASVFQDTTERKQAEQAVRESEEKFRTLFETIDEGFVIQEVIVDDGGRVVDMIYREANAAFGTHTGLSEVNGKRTSELFPQLEQSWLDVLTRVYQTGIPVRAEGYNSDLNRWISTHYSRVGGAGSPFIAAVFNDITERKQREELQQYLLKLSDTLRPLSDATKIQLAATEILGEHLGVDRAQYADIDESQGDWVVTGSYLRDGATPFAGAGRIEDFGRQSEKQRAGITVAVADAATDANLSSAEREAFLAIEARAVLSVPLIKEGRWAATLSLHHSTAREWSEDEIKLAQETAERTWAAVERARAEDALRQSEVKFRTLFDSIDEGVSTFEVVFDENGEPIDLIFIENNPAFTAVTGLTADVIGKRTSEVVPNLERLWIETYGRVVKTGISERFESSNVDTGGDWYEVYAARVGDGSSNRVVIVYNNITERKQRERQQEFILKFSDALRAETNADAVANRALLMLFEELSLDRCYIGVYRLEDDRADFTHQVGNERVPPLPDDGIRLSDFPEALRIAFDRTLVIEDFAETEGLSDTDRRSIAALGLRALVAATVRKGENKPLWAIVAVSASPRRWTRGEIALIEDVTERTWAAVERARAEEALRESEARFRAAYEQANVGIVQTDIEGKILVPNPGFCKIIGYTEEEAKQLSVLDITHPDDYDADMQKARRVVDGELNGYTIEKRYIRKTGEVVWVKMTSSLVRDAAGEPFYALAIIEDITERKRVEEELRLANYRFQVAEEASKGFLYDWNLETGEVVRSESLTSVLGWSLMELTETVEGWREFVHPDDYRAAEKKFTAHLADPQADAMETEYRARHKTGGYRYVYDRALILRDAEGRAARVIGQTIDVTALKETEQALRESEGRLRALVENLPGGAVFVLDRDLRYLIAEGEALAAAGFKPRDFIGKTIFEALPSDLACEYEPNFRRALAGKSYQIEHEAHDRTFVSRGVPLKDSNGDVYAVLAISYDITDRKQTEELLRESEERLRLATEAAEMYSWEFDIERGAYKFSANAARILGIAKKRLPVTVEDTLAFVHPDDKKTIERTLKKAIRAGEGFTLDFRTVTSRGKNVWLAVQSAVVKDEKGKPTRIIGIAQNVTQRKQAEEMLRESEERIRIAIEAGGLGTWEWDIAGERVVWNEQHFKLFGMKPVNKPLKPEDFFYHVYREDRERVREQLNKAVETKIPFEAEFRADVENDGIRWMNGYGRVIETDSEGKATKMSGVMFDITTRKRAEEALRKSEEQLQLILESTKDYAIVTFDLKGFITRWNTGAERIFGYPEKEVLGQNGAFLFTPEDRAQKVPESEMQTALEKGRAEDERWHVRKDGTRFFMSGVMQPLKDGKAEGFVKIARDQTEQLAAETALREKETLRKLVAAQEEERKRIARDLHDELGQQLTALRIKLETVSKNQSDAALLNQLNDIQNIARSIDDGVDFLAWELRPSTLDDLGLTAALDNYIKQWSHYAGVKAELTVTNLKRARFAPEIETCLYRLVQEALNNTHKHAAATNVDIILEKRGDLLILIVEDNGKGFDQKSKMNRQKGIGLTGMRERAALVGGTLEIETAPERGTTIYVRIPFSAVKEK